MLENIIRKAAIGFGLALLAASIYLSYDGFDQKVTGGNTEYTLLAVAIGVSIAIAFTILEFIVTSETKGLNATLKWLGLAAYAYSIYTNYIGLTHLLNMDKIFAGIVAFAMDVAPEQMIAWGLGEAIMHDLFGNLGKFASTPIGKKDGGGKGQGGGQQNQRGQEQSRGDHQHPPQNQRYPFPQQGRGNTNHQGGSNRRAQLEAQYRKPANFDELSDTGKMRAIRNLEQ